MEGRRLSQLSTTVKVSVYCSGYRDKQTIANADGVNLTHHSQVCYHQTTVAYRGAITKQSAALLPTPPVLAFHCDTVQFTELDIQTNLRSL